MALTELACKSAKPKDKPIKMSDSGGLYLHIMSNGAKYWRIQYRFNGKQKLLAAGVYDTVSLVEARKRRDEAKELLAQNIDPSLAKQQRKQLAALDQGNTFEKVALSWIEHMRDGWSPITTKHTTRRLEMNLYPQIGKAALKDITPQILLAAMKKIESRGAHEIGQIFRYAIVNGITDRNPAQDLKGALRPQKTGHYASIETKELPELLHALERNDARLYTQTRLAIKFLLLTFVRTTEMIQATWSEIDFDEKEWRIPAARMKMRKPHIVPLSRQCIAILKELKEANVSGEWVFPSMAHPRKHMSNGTVLLALKRMGYAGRMTGHGFRALAMTTLKERLNYPHDIIDRQLAHAHRNKVDAAYDRAQFLPQRKKMMQEWADYVDKLAATGQLIKGKFNKAA
jgi:integrase